MKRHWYFQLQDRIPVPIEGSDESPNSPEFNEALVTWAKYMADNDRTVQQERLGPFFISTVFLGMNVHLWEEGPPQLFETMVFDERKAHEGTWQERTSTWELALEAHQRGVEWARSRLP